jgi:hypothetical protein
MSDYKTTIINMYGGPGTGKALVLDTFITH